MGVVVAAHHRDLDRRVALKFMHDEYSRNAMACATSTSRRSSTSDDSRTACRTS